jgi:(p)ppGpp synthase/HD superfamily hydrolase
MTPAYFQIARKIVHAAFSGKVDKGGRPYVDHLERVAYNVEGGGVVATVALLHDLLEDCPEWSPERLLETGFSREIVKAVLCLTRTPGMDYDEYITRVSRNEIARRVKIADLRDNMDITRLPALTERDVSRLIKYHRAYIFLTA